MKLPALSDSSSEVLTVNLLPLWETTVAFTAEDCPWQEPTPVTMMSMFAALVKKEGSVTV